VSNALHLTLLVGPVVPIPVPHEVLDALTSVQVTNKTQGASAFQLAFQMSNRSPLETVFLLVGGGLPPVLRLILIVTINGTPEVLIDGVVTNSQLTPGSGQTATKLTVTGEDLTRLMDYIDSTGFPFPAMPAEARVALILAKYAVFGMIPLIVPSVMIDVPIPTERIPRQQGKDLAYLRKLAKDVGYTFYVEPGPVPGTNIAYWGPEIRVGVPQPALNVDMDAYTNVDSVNLAFDSENAVLPILMIQNPQTKLPIPIPLPGFSPFSPPLGLLPPIPKNIEFWKGAAKLTAAQAIMIGMAESLKRADAATATGTLDVFRYGRVLKARRLVGLRGVGLAFDGLYFVKSVTHEIKRGEYKQNFTLVRNGLISTVPAVPA
jgi:hypothetical protein